MEPETWKNIEDEYGKDEYPPFGGPFTDAKSPWEWLKDNYHPPVRKEKKLTAMEWIHQIAKEREPDKFDWEKAIEMEKKQIVNAWHNGFFNGYDGGNNNNDINPYEAKQYYNEIYGK